ncbi:MAG: glycosyltransferase family 39 protein [Bryobacterales bacterium]
MLAIAIAGPATIQSAFDRLSADGSANVNAVAIQHTAAALAALFGLLAGGLWRNHASIAGWLSGLVGDVVREGVAQWQASRGALTATSVVHRGTLGFIILAGVVIRLIHLGAPMRYDEAYTFNSYVSQSLPRILVDYWPNNHVLHSILSHLSTMLLGDAPWAIRLPAFLAGVLLIPAIYLLLARFASAEAALVAAGLTAASPPLVAYSVNARGYTLVALLFLGLAAVTLELQRRDDRALWAYFVLFATAGLFTIPTMAFAIALCGTALVLSRIGKGMSAGFLLHMGTALGCTAALTAALYSPAILVSGLGVMLDNRFVEAVPWAEFPSQWRANLGFLWEAWHSGWPGWMRLAVWMAAAAGLTFLLLRRSSSPLVYLAFGLLGCVALVLAKRVVPVQRVWLFLVPLYLGFAGIGVSAALRRLAAASRSATLAPALALAACLVGGGFLTASRSVYNSVETGAAPDSERVATVLSDSLRPGDRLVVSALYSHSVWYYVRRAIGSTYDSGPDEPQGRLFVVVDSAEKRSLDELLRARGVDGGNFVEEKKLWESAGAEVLELHHKAPAHDPI